MSLAFESSANSIQQSGFIHWMPSCAGIFSGDRRLPVVEREEKDLEDSNGSSSIGRNSDLSGGEECEVESSYKGPLDAMNALEEVLPVKKSISKFYNGKSKSFTSLSVASSASSIKDLAKPESPYTRKRKNLFVHGNLLDTKHNFPPKENRSGVSKRPANSNRSTVDFGSTVGRSKSNNNSEDCHAISLSPSCCLPPLHPNGKRSPSNETWSLPPQWNSPWRSFSLSDLQCATAATSNH